MRHITFVKRVLAGGQGCTRCANVNRQLKNDGLLNKINHQVVADDSDADSLGIRLAKHYAMTQVPFFIVDDGSGKAHAFQDYQEFKHFIQA